MEHLKLLDEYRDEMIDTLAGLIKIRSVQGNAVTVRSVIENIDAADDVPDVNEVIEPENDAGIEGSDDADSEDADAEAADDAEPGNIVDRHYPYGVGVDEAYQYMLDAGRSMGFDTADFDRYGGHIEWHVPGADRTFGIVAHLDVVPEGTGWQHDPYGAEIVDGRMYGRGTQDDKGPCVAALYAMKALRESGFQPDMNIRLILGLDEETGMTGIDRYIDGAGAPDMGFTPDAQFPLINGEKGMLVFDLAEKMHKHTTKEGLVLRKITGGTVHNAVPDSARAVIAAEDASYYDRIRERADAFTVETGHELLIKKSGTSLTVESAGKAAHGASPEEGLNAISILMDFLGRFEFAGDEVNEFIAYYNDHIGYNVHGEAAGCDLSDEESGRLTFNAGICSLSDDVAAITIDIRYPVTFQADDIYAGIEESISGSNIGIVKDIENPPVYIDAADPLASGLLSAYAEETGDDAVEPIVIGGGTYSKKFDRMLAFGAIFPGEEDRMHQADESVEIDSLMKASRIYARAMYKLCSQNDPEVLD